MDTEKIPIVNPEPTPEQHNPYNLDENNQVSGSFTSSNIDRRNVMRHTFKRAGLALLVISLFGISYFLAALSQTRQTEISSPQLDEASVISLDGKTLDIHVPLRVEQGTELGDLTANGTARFLDRASFDQGVTIKGDTTIDGNITLTGTINGINVADFIGGGATQPNRGPAGARGPQGIAGQNGINGTNGTNGSSTPTCTNGGCVSLQGSGGVQETGSINISGSVRAGDLIPNTVGVVSATTITDVTSINYSYNDNSRWIAIAPDGFARIAFVDSNTYELKYVQCTNNDCSTNVVTTIDSDPTNGLDLPSLALDASGNAFISYLAYESPNVIKLASCTNVDCSVNTIQTVGTASPYSYSNSVAVGPDGLAQVIFESYDSSAPLHELSYVRCINISCSSNTTNNIESTATLSSYFETTSLAVGSDGLARMSYVDGSTDKLKFARCNDAACSSPVIRIIDDSRYYTSLALGADNNAFISYDHDGDSSGSQVYLAHCIDNDCSSFTANLVGSSPNGYDTNSVAIGLDGFARISYFYADNSNGDSLRNVQCKNLDCSISSEAIVDTDFDYANSIAIGQDGFARIVYVNSDRSRLKLARLQSGDGVTFSTYGSSIGSPASSYGKAYFQNVILRSTDDNPLLVLEQGGESGKLIDFSYDSLLVATLSSDEDGLKLQGTVALSGDVSVTGETTLNGAVSLVGSLLKVQDNSGLNVLQLNPLNASLIVGNSTTASKFERVDYPSSFATALASADFNGDNRTDIIQASLYSNTASILINNGNGTFAAKVDYAISGSSRSVITGDFDGNGSIDFAVASINTSVVSIFFNNGDGTFAPKVDHVTGLSPYSVTTADFNGDGSLDLATANYSANTTSVLLNNGDGTFATKVDYATGSLPHSIASADISGDGFPDIVVTNSNNNTVSILINNGNGSFAPRVNYSTGSSPRSVTLADFNTDGSTDIAVANTLGNSISILLNNGNGTFAAKSDYSAGGFPTSITSADFNTDGSTDITLTNLAGNTATVLINNGSGSFTLDAVYSIGRHPEAITASDFNNDGLMDFATGSEGSVSVLLNKSISSSKTPALKIYSGGNDIIRAEGLGNKQVLRVDSLGNTQIGGDSSADAFFESTVTQYATGIFPNDVVVADFNKDGDLDFSVANGSSRTVSVYINNGNGTFAPKIDYSVGNYPQSITSADLNGDGYPDIATANQLSSDMTVLINNGNGTFAARVDYPVGGRGYSVTAADFNGDESPDLAVTDSDNARTSIFINNGNGTFAPRVSYATGSSPYAIIAVDFNSDGRLDLATANAGAGTASVLINNGDGTFTPKIDYVTGGLTHSITSADFNGDGSFDIATVNGNVNTASIFFNNGDGTFTPKIDYAVGSVPFSVTSADFNGDGKPDLAVVGIESKGVAILLNNGNGTFADKLDQATGSTPYSVKSADFNKDFKPDLVIANQSSRNASVLFGKSDIPRGRLTVLDIAGSATLFNLGTTGDLKLQNSVNSTSALQVSDAAGAVVLTADTTNKRVGIGLADPDSVLTVAATDVTNSQINLRSTRVSIASGNLIGGIKFSTNDTDIAMPGALAGSIEARASANHTNLVRTTDLVFNTVSGTTQIEALRLTGAGVLQARAAVFTGNLTVNGHIITGNTSGNTTVAAGAAACTTPAVSISGNDVAGTVTVTTGTGCAATGTLATVTFAVAYGVSPRVTLTPGNANAATLQYYKGSTTANFTVATRIAPTNTTIYIFDYHVLQ